MRDTLNEFVVIHPYTEEEFIHARLRALGCTKFTVINIKELSNINTLTFNLTKFDSLKFNPTYPEISFNPSYIFIQYEPSIKNLHIGERIERNEIGSKEIEIETKMSLIACNSHMTFWENSLSLHTYNNIGPSIINASELLYKNQFIDEIVTIGKYIKGNRYTLRFNYDLFLKLCTYINKYLKYV